MFPQTEADKQYAAVQAELMQLVPLDSFTQPADRQNGSNGGPSYSYSAATTPCLGVDTTSLNLPAVKFSQKSRQSDIFDDEDLDDSDYSDDDNDMLQTPWAFQSHLHSDREFFLSFQPLAPLSVPRPVSWPSSFPSLNSQRFENNFLGLQFGPPHPTTTMTQSRNHIRSPHHSRLPSVSAESDFAPDGTSPPVYRACSDLETTFQPDLKNGSSRQMTKPVRPSRRPSMD